MLPISSGMAAASRPWTKLFGQNVKLESLTKHLLEFSQCSKSKVLLNSAWSQHKWSCEVLCLGDIALNVGALSHSLDSLHALDQAVGEPGRSIGHGESGRASTVLGLHHLSASVLDAYSECVQGVRSV